MPITVDQLLDYIKRGPVAPEYKPELLDDYEFNSAEKRNEASQGDSHNPSPMPKTQQQAIVLEEESEEETEYEGDQEYEGDSKPDDYYFDLAIDPQSETEVVNAITEYLIEAPWERSTVLDQTDADGHCLLLWAIAKGYFEVLNLLLKTNANASAQGPDGPAVVYAASLNRWDMVCLLLEKNADVQATDSQGESVLTWAVRLGKGTMVHLLISKYGATINDITAWDAQIQKDPYKISLRCKQTFVEPVDRATIIHWLVSRQQLHSQAPQSQQGTHFNFPSAPVASESSSVQSCMNISPVYTPMAKANLNPTTLSPTTTSPTTINTTVEPHVYPARDGLVAASNPYLNTLSLGF